MLKYKVGDMVRYCDVAKHLTYIKPCVCGHLYFSFHTKPHIHEYRCMCGELLTLEYGCATEGIKALSPLIDEITYLKQLEDL